MDATKPCEICGATTSEAEIYFSDEGETRPTCYTDIDLKTNLRKGTQQHAWEALGILGVARAFTDPFGLGSLLALIWSLRFFRELMTKDPDHAEALESMKGHHTIVATVAGLGGLQGFVATVMGMVG